MVKFAHLADVHLGGWKIGPMQELNFKAFERAIQISIDNKVEFVLIAGDLFDSAYPPIEILKETFALFKKLKDAKIPVFIIPGSHDYSVSGKSFLDVLEKAGFCKNVYNPEEKENEIILAPTIYQGVAIYGYPGKKSSMEIQNIRKIKLSDAPGMFKILMLHTTLDKVRGVMPVECLKTEELPEANYYAMGHIHVDLQYKNIVYPGPIFPNNFLELETLQNGSFYIVDTEDLYQPFKKIDLILKEIEALEIRVKNTKTATEDIINELQKRNLKDKIVLLRLSGTLENQKVSDINLAKIETAIYEGGAYFFLKNTKDLKTRDPQLKFEIKDKKNLEKKSIEQYSKENPSKFNDLIPELIHILSNEKQEGETVDSFNTRLLDDAKKLLKIE